MAEDQKQDMIDRKGAWIERMFDRLFSAIQKDTKGTIMILSVALNFYLAHLYIKLNATTKEEMIKEVRNSVQRQVAPLYVKQDSIKTSMDSLKMNADTSLSNLNGTVESVKQYFNENKKK